jgi:hypothetical protein
LAAKVGVGRGRRCRGSYKAKDGREKMFSG